MQLHDLAGIVGVILIVGTYLALQLERLSARDVRYSLLNAVGAALVIVSLMWEFNLSAFLVETFWLGISVGGLVRAWGRG